MPVQQGKDSEGCYMRWGNSGKKYYYICGDDVSRKRARQKALLQARAILANQGT